MNVEELLISKNITYIPKGKDFVVSCLNPEHADRNPSMRIDQVTGIFNCFSCEYKGNLFSLYGEKANPREIRKQTLRKKIQEKKAESIGLSMPLNFLPYVGNWRNIRPETYKHFGAFQHTATEFSGRICFPIKDRTGRIVAFQGRTTTDQIPKYLNSPAGAKLPLFPAVKPVQGRILLVEGIFDVVNLFDKGITNAMCCFGVKNVTEEKLQVLSVSGVDGIDIFLDNDEAGQSGSEKIKELCEKVGLMTRNISFGNKELDAGALVQSQVDKLRTKLYG